MRMLKLRDMNWLGDGDFAASGRGSCQDQVSGPLQPAAVSNDGKR
jgi:hypothetical protein